MEATIQRLVPAGAEHQHGASSAGRSPVSAEVRIQHNSFNELRRALRVYVKREQ